MTHTKKNPTPLRIEDISEEVHHLQQSSDLVILSVSSVSTKHQSLGEKQLPTSETKCNIYYLHTLISRIYPGRDYYKTGLFLFTLLSRNQGSDSIKVFL